MNNYLTIYTTIVDFYKNFDNYEGILVYESEL